MDKKSDITVRAASAPTMNVTAQPTYQAPAPVRRPPVRAPQQGTEEHEVIFRYRYNEQGELEQQILPATLHNLTHLEEEDQVTQSNRHHRTLTSIDDILRRRLEGPGVGVFCDFRIYWGDESLSPSSPDVFVVFNLKRPAAELEQSFNVAQEGTRPSLIFEVVSATYKGMRDKDYVHNIEHYAKAGVQELVFVEPMTKGSPGIRHLQALRLDGGAYKEISPDQNGRFTLQTVGMTVQLEKGELILCDAKTGERFLNSAEEEAGRKAEAEARKAVEAENERLRAMIERLQRSS